MSKKELNTIIQNLLEHPVECINIFFSCWFSYVKICICQHNRTTSCQNRAIFFARNRAQSAGRNREFRMDSWTQCMKIIHI